MYRGMGGETLQSGNQFIPNPGTPRHLTPVHELGKGRRKGKKKKSESKRISLKEGKGLEL